MTGASSAIPSVTPIFFEVGVHDIYREGSRGQEVPRVISIDAYSPTKPLAERRFTRIVNPETEISDTAIQRYGITNLDVQGSPKFGKAWKDFQKWANGSNPENSKVVLVAHRIYGFHSKVLQRECERTGTDYPETKAFDTAWLAYCVHNKKWKDYSLGQIVKELGGSGENLGGKDVYDVFKAMIGETDPAEVYPLMLSGNPIKAVAAQSKGKPLPQSVPTAFKTHAVAIRTIFYDTETTGLLKKNKSDPGENPRIVELSAYDPDRNEYFSRLINPEMPIPSGASNVHHIYDNMVEAKPTYKQVWKDFTEWANAPIDGKKPEVVLVAHNNYGFDAKMLKIEAERVGSVVPRDWHMFCTLYLVRCLKMQRPHRLQSLRERYGIEVKEAHRAEDDVRVLYEVYQKVIGSADHARLAEEMISRQPHVIKRVAHLIQQAGGPAAEIGSPSAGEKRSRVEVMDEAEEASPASKKPNRGDEENRERAAANAFLKKHGDTIPDYARFLFENEEDAGKVDNIEAMAEADDEDLRAEEEEDSLGGFIVASDDDGEEMSLGSSDGKSDKISLRKKEEKDEPVYYEADDWFSDAEEDEPATKAEPVVQENRMEISDSEDSSASSYDSSDEEWLPSGEDVEELEAEVEALRRDNELVGAGAAMDRNPRKRARGFEVTDNASKRTRFGS